MTKKKLSVLLQYDAWAIDIQRMYVDEKIPLHRIAIWLASVGVSTDVQLRTQHGRLATWLNARGLRMSISEAITAAVSSPHTSVTKNCKHCKCEFIAPKIGWTRWHYCQRCVGPEFCGKHMLERYDLSWPEYKMLLYAQNNSCGVCGRDDLLEIQKREPRLVHIDHDHETGKVRGIVCHRCNQRLAILDDKQWTKKGYAYLLRQKRLKDE